jgi:hypothetical protein
MFSQLNNIQHTYHDTRNISLSNYSPNFVVYLIILFKIEGYFDESWKSLKIKEGQSIEAEMSIPLI